LLRDSYLETLLAIIDEFELEKDEREDQRETESSEIAAIHG
jgi:hypothetical protein